MEKFVGLVFFRRGPSKMSFVDTSQMPLAATMSRLMLKRRRRAIDVLTDEAMDMTMATVQP
jgi:hypothetical protein